MNVKKYTGALAIVLVVGMAAAPSASAAMIVWDWQGILDVTVSCSTPTGISLVGNCYNATSNCISKATCPAALSNCRPVDLQPAGPGWRIEPSLTPLGTASMGVPLVQAPEWSPEPTSPGAGPDWRSLVQPYTYSLVVNYHCLY